MLVLIKCAPHHLILFSSIFFNLRFILSWYKTWGGGAFKSIMLLQIKTHRAFIRHASCTGYTKVGLLFLCSSRIQIPNLQVSLYFHCIRAQLAQQEQNQIGWNLFAFDDVCKNCRAAKFKIIHTYLYNYFKFCRKL